MHNFIQMYNTILDIAKTTCSDFFDDKYNVKFYKNNPKCSDLQIISMSIALEACDFKSENGLYKSIKECLPDFFITLPDRSNFNRRRRVLADVTDRISLRVSQTLSKTEDTFIVDSTPIPICRYVRAMKIKILKNDFELYPNRGFLPIDKQYFFGFKLHCVTSTSGVILNYIVTPASQHDIGCLKDLSDLLPNTSTIIGDKGYISKPIQLALFEEKKLVVKTQNRANQRPNHLFTTKESKQRKRIETVFSQLKDKLSLTCNYAKKIDGFETRITSKIAAFTMLQYNNFKLGKPIGRVFFPDKKDKLAKKI